jgi:hypothetical protein
MTASAAAPVVLSGRELDDLVRSHLPLVGHLVREMLTRLPAHVCRETSSPPAWPPSPPPPKTTTAIEVGLQHHDGLLTSHVAHEAQAVRGIVPTSEPKRYSGATVPLLVL